jgi:purine-binding chemotaxis protein CheW
MSPSLSLRKSCWAWWRSWCGEFLSFDVETVLSTVSLKREPMAEEQQLEPQMEAEQLELLPQSVPLRQYCVFRTGRERFCLSVLDVEEVVEWPNLTKVPLSPTFLMGVFNLRGSIVPVVDIAFTEGRRPDLPPKHVVVAALHLENEGEDLRIGIAADEVIGTYSTSQPLLVDAAPLEVPHCCGMLRHEDRLALALDLKKLTEAFPVPVI